MNGLGAQDSGRETDKERRLEQIRAEALRSAPSPSASRYYGQPLLKAPVWTWEVPLYFFTGGAAGAASVIALVAEIAHAADVASHARWIAVAGAGVSAPLLISDLGRPERFFNMLRVLKLRSPMSIGAWTLALYSAVALASVMRIGGLSVDLIAAAGGLMLATYTGVLIGATAIPVWSQHATLLPLHFGASALGAAVSLIELTGPRSASLNAIGIAAAAIETIVGMQLERRRNADARALFHGTGGGIARLGGVLSGPAPLVLRLVAASSPGIRIMAAAATIIGSLLTRIAWLAAGRRSVAS